MSLETFFEGAYDKFKSWFTSEKEAVVQEAKSVIDELAPIVKADIITDGSSLLMQAGTALAAGEDPLVLIPALATSVWKEALAQGIDLSKAASTAAGAILVSKAKALSAQSAGPSTASADLASASVTS